MSFLIHNYGDRLPASFIKGEGCRLYDADNNEYLDFGSGISVTNLGHNHPAVVEAVVNQARSVIHTSNLYEIKLQSELAELISRNSFGGKLFFCNSGAEANEAAIKLARLYGNVKHGGKRYKIISMYNSFHGRTYATMGATAQEKIQKGFTPMPAYNQYAVFNDIESLKQAVSMNDCAAVILELFQGEGGVVPVNADFLKAVRQICDENDMLMILDEVQTGYGRTGKLFAYQLFGAEPDIMSLAKGIANGVPMGAIAVKNEIAELFTPGSHGSTFGGNPLACAAGIAVIKEMTKDGFLESVVEKGRVLREYISSELAGDCVLRGEGLLIGVETKIPPRDVVEACFKKKLLVIPAGSGSVRLYPPLNISCDDLLEGAKIYVSVIKELLK